MAKKMGVNSKVEAAKARKSATESDRKEQEAREKEGQYWREGEGAKSRAAKNREEKAVKRAEAAAKKAEARRLAEQEEKELDKSTRKQKVTEEELRRRREEEYAAMQRRVAEEKRKQSRTADERECLRMVSVANTNRDDSVIEARTVEDAIAQMTVVDSLPVDKHPERRLKASFKAFEEAELQRLKEEKPGLTLAQYKDMVWKLWKKSQDNQVKKHKTQLRP
ncbi:hypothetical protein Pfo_004573 [Paulownia fortunei]|nr:hypothetical protein Pfo_004573 [Paulownia fortunei]